MSDFLTVNRRDLLKIVGAGGALSACDLVPELPRREVGRDVRRIDSVLLDESDRFALCPIECHHRSQQLLRHRLVERIGQLVEYRHVA